jgi:hypothetical protein
MAKIYGTLPVDLIKTSTIIPNDGIPVDLSEIQEERLGNRLNSLNEYNTYQSPDMARITALAKKVATETKLSYTTLLLWSKDMRDFDTPRFLGLAKNHVNMELLFPKKIIQCWPLLQREEEQTDSQGNYRGTMYYCYCLTSSGDLVVISRGSNFVWEYNPSFGSWQYYGGSHSEPIKNDDVKLFDYKALWQTKKQSDSHWEVGNRHPCYDVNTYKPHPERKCLVEYPGEGIIIMLEGLLYGGRTTYRVENNKVTSSEIEAYRKHLKEKGFLEAYAYTDDEITLIIQYLNALRALISSYDSLEENAVYDNRGIPDEASQETKERITKQFKEMLVHKYPGETLPSDSELAALYEDSLTYLTGLKYNTIKPKTDNITMKNDIAKLKSETTKTNVATQNFSSVDESTHLESEKFTKQEDDSTGISSRSSVFDKQLIDAASFRMPVNNVFTIKGRGIVVVGVVEQGMISVGDRIQIVGVNDERLDTVVNAIEKHKALFDSASAGEDIGILIKGFNETDVIQGQIIVSFNNNTKMQNPNETNVIPNQSVLRQNNITPSIKFKASVYHHTKEEGGRFTPLVSGFRPHFSFGEKPVSGVIKLPDGKDLCNPGESVTLIVELDSIIPIEKGKHFEIREGGLTISTGVIIDIL